jgi:hypothetical protein
MKMRRGAAPIFVSMRHRLPVHHRRGTFDMALNVSNPASMPRTSAASAAQLQASANQRPTQINLLPGNFSHVVGVTNSKINGGAYLLVPQDSRTGSPTVFLSGTAVTSLASRVLGSPDVDAATKAAFRRQYDTALGQVRVNTSFGLVATINLQKVADGDLTGMFEIGVGGTTTFADGDFAAFYNGRVNPSDGTVSGNVGWLGNAGGFAAELLERGGAVLRGQSAGLALASGGTASAPAGFGAALGQVMHTIGFGAKEFGEATGTKVWYGQAGRGSLTPGSPTDYNVRLPNGSQVRLNLDNVLQGLTQVSRGSEYLQNQAKNYLAWEKATNLRDFVSKKIASDQIADPSERQAAQRFVNQVTTALENQVPGLLRDGILQRTTLPPAQIGGPSITRLGVNDILADVVNQTRQQPEAFRGNLNVFEREYNIYLRGANPLPRSLQQEAQSLGLYKPFGQF